MREKYPSRSIIFDQVWSVDVVRVCLFVVVFI